jgi:hypothetical protein
MSSLPFNQKMEVIKLFKTKLYKNNVWRIIRTISFKSNQYR